MPITHYPEPEQKTAEELISHAKEWGRKVHQHLADAYPHRDSEKQLAAWRRQVESEHQHVSLITFIRAVDEFILFCNKAGRYANQSFWHGLITGHRNEILDKSQQELPLDARLLLNEWQKYMDETRTDWELAEIMRFQAEFLQDLERFIEALEALQEHAHDIELDPGIFLDLSTAPLTAQNIEQLSRWTKYLAENGGVRQLCEILGKMRDTETLTDHLEMTTVTKPLKTIDISPDPKEEIIGIRLGRDIEYALPTELSLLSDPDVALLFDRKYFESRITSFDMQGIAPVLAPVKVLEKAPDPEKDNLGPMIICIDTSGSMAGMPETVAKAVALFMAYQAKSQHRPCYLINFATEIETLDLNAEDSDRDLLAFLQMSFHCGTDVSPAISHAVTMMAVEAFEKADLLIISDFIIGNIPAEILAEMAAQRKADNRFYSLAIGAKYLYNRHKTLFDREWAFDPVGSKVYQVTV
ncbi:MAG: hypothetical protein CR975_07490 [Gammaproteobacteria bacterium]|nr:MAG: hypothetical protein CR975_07490 [Gammaproteobacteria bacterium]